MRHRTVLTSLFLVAGLGCSSTIPVPVAKDAAARLYNGGASVGDSLAITLDPAALTLTYKNISNGDTGVVSYTVNADGTYTLTGQTWRAQN